MRDYIDRRVTPPKRVTSATWGPPPSCKQVLIHELRKRQIPKLSRTNCVTIQLTTVRAWSNEPGWLALPRRLLSPYYMKRARPDQPFFLIEIGSNVHGQCVTRCPVSRLVHSPGRPVSVTTWKISTRDLGITILGCQLTGLARLCCKDFRRGPAGPYNLFLARWWFNHFQLLAFTIFSLVNKCFTHFYTGQKTICLV